MPKRPRSTTPNRPNGAPPITVADLEVLIGRKDTPDSVVWADQDGGYCLKSWEALLMALLLGTPANPLHDATIRREVSLAVNLGQALCLQRAVRRLRPVVVWSTNGGALSQKPAASTVPASCTPWGYAASMTDAARRGTVLLQSLQMDVTKVEECLKGTTSSAGITNQEMRHTYSMAAYLGDLLPRSQLDGDLVGQQYALQGALFAEQVDVAVIVARLTKPAVVPPPDMTRTNCQFTKFICRTLGSASPGVVKHVLPAINLQAFLDCVDRMEILESAVGNYDVFRLVWDDVAWEGLAVDLSRLFRFGTVPLIYAAFLGGQRVFEFLLDHGDTSRINFGWLFEQSILYRPNFVDALWTRFRDHCPQKGDTERWSRILQSAIESDQLVEPNSSSRLEFLLDRFGQEFDIVAALRTMLERALSGRLVPLTFLHARALHSRETTKFLVEVAGVELDHDDGGALVKKAYRRTVPFPLISYLSEKGVPFPAASDRAALVEMINAQIWELPSSGGSRLSDDFDRFESLKLLFASGRIDPKERMFPRGRGIQHRLVFPPKDSHARIEVWSKFFTYLVEALDIDFTALDDDGESPFLRALEWRDIELLSVLYRYKPLPDGRSRFLPSNLLQWRSKGGCSMMIPALKVALSNHDSSHHVEAFKPFCAAVGIENLRELAKVEWMDSYGCRTNLLNFLVESQSEPLLRFCLEEIRILPTDAQALQDAWQRWTTDSIQFYPSTTSEGSETTQ